MVFQAVELKGSVFKKFEKTNLFQMACSDARERFHLVILILIVLFRNMADFNWDVGEQNKNATKSFTREIFE